MKNGGYSTGLCFKNEKVQFSCRQNLNYRVYCPWIYTKEMEVFVSMDKDFRIGRDKILMKLKDVYTLIKERRKDNE